MTVTQFLHSISMPAVVPPWHGQTQSFWYHFLEHSLSALTLLLGGSKGIRPLKTEWWWYWYGYLSGVRCNWFAYGPTDATATPSSLASLKSRMVLPFWCQLTQVVLEKVRSKLVGMPVHRCTFNCTNRNTDFRQMTGSKFYPFPNSHSMHTCYPTTERSYHDHRLLWYHCTLHIINVYYYICWLLRFWLNWNEDVQLFHYATQFICNASTQTINIITTFFTQQKIW